MRAEIFKEKLYNVLSKARELEKTNPGATELVSSFLELFMDFAEFQNDTHLRHQANINDLNDRITSLSLQNNSSCCNTQQPQKNKQRVNVSDDTKKLADELFGTSQNNNYEDYINSKRKETADFIKTHNKVENENILKEDLNVLSDFIDKKIGK